jgi:hypothetical protein
MTQHTEPAAGEQRRADYDRHLTTAAEALTAAIGCAAGDGGEIVSHLLATVAANLGGPHAITAGRPGSWEADHVDQMLSSTVGCDGEYLWRYRTAAVEVVVCVEDDLIDVDHARLYDVSADLCEQRIRAGLPAAATEEQHDEVEEQIERAYELIEQLRESEYADYAARFEAALRDVVGEFDDLNPELVSVRFIEWDQVEQVVAGVSHGGTRLAKHSDWRSLEYQLWERARQQTPPPGPASVGSQLPHLRIPQLAHIQPAAAEEAGR